MKRAEITAEKNSLRNEINTIRAVINEQLFTKKSIPQKVVNGSLADVLEFKKNAERAGAIYHIQNEPGKTLSLPELKKLMAKLKNIANGLGVL